MKLWLRLKTGLIDLWAWLTYEDDPSDDRWLSKKLKGRWYPD